MKFPWDEKTQEALLKRMLGNIVVTEDKSENSLVHDSLAPASIALAEFYIDLETIAGKLQVENQVGDELDMWVEQITGLTRRPATRALVHLTVEADPGTTIPKNSRVLSQTTSFVTLDECIVGSEGTGVVDGICEQEGSVGIIPAMQINRLEKNVFGVKKIYNLKPSFDGYDIEDDDTLRERYWERLRMPPTSGNKYHYREWAKEISGVGKVYVESLWNGANTVRLTIVDVDNKPASPSLVQKVQEYIDPKKTSGRGDGKAPIGAYLTVQSPEVKKVNITCTLVHKGDKETILRIFKEKLDAYARKIVLDGKAFSYAVVGSLLLEIEGVEDYLDLKLNEDTKNIPLSHIQVVEIEEVVLNE